MARCADIACDPVIGARLNGYLQARCVQLGSDLQTVYVDGAEINDQEHSFASNGIKIDFKLDLKSCSVAVTQGGALKLCAILVFSDN